MIPKTIYYCWFGGNPLPALAEKCIASWKKFLPEYEIKEINEGNYDAHKNPYIAQAYDAKKYAFVSDYARFDVLYEYGGIYLDTDVEVIKDLSPVLARGAFMGMESCGRVATGLGMACEKGDFLVKAFLDSYTNSSFLKSDGTYNLATVVDRCSLILKNYGLTNSCEIQTAGAFTIYPPEYFCPKDIRTGKISITENTYTIHHYDGSWLESWMKDIRMFADSMYKKEGDNLKTHLKVIFYHIGKSVKHYGFFGALVYWKKNLSGRMQK